MDYVCGIKLCLTLQHKGGASVSARWIVIRILAGAWCLACFFLIQLYCSTLTSHLTSPLRKPLIDSVYDIPNTPGLQIVVDRGFAADTLLSVGYHYYLLLVLKKNS